MDVANGITIFKLTMPHENMYIHMLHVSQWLLQEGLIKCLAKFRVISFNLVFHESHLRYCITSDYRKNAKEVFNFSHF